MVTVGATAIRESAFTDSYGSFGGTVISRGGLAFYIFFVLSAYLISRPFVRAFIYREPMPPIGAYLRNRALRILPVFWIVFTILLIIHGTRGGSAAEVAAVYGFLQTYWPSEASYLIGQGWSLGVEMAFYLLIPLLALGVIAARRRRHDGHERRVYSPATRRWLLIGFLVLLAVGSLAFRQLLPATPDYRRSLPGLMFSFVPGVFLAAIETAPRRLSRRTMRMVALVLGLAAVPILGIGTYELGEWGTIGVILGAGTMVGAPLLLQRSGGGAWRILDNRMLHWIGERSYSIYVIHWAVLIEFLPDAPRADDAWLRMLGMLAVALPITLVLAELSFRLIERPALSRRRNWRRRTAVAAPDPAVA